MGYAIIYLGVGVNSVDLMSSWLLFSVLVVVSFVDLDTRRIPNVITYPVAVVGLAIAAVPGGLGFRESAMGLLVGGGSLFVVSVLSGGGMGLGDAKLMAVVGAFLGWRAALFAIFAGSLIGSVVGVSLMVMKVIKRRQPIPFGPFLALGTCVTWAILAFHSGLFPYLI